VRPCITGGSLIPLSQTLLMRIFPKEKAPAAMALWAMTTLVAPVLGPILGGWLCDSVAWPAIFFINAPIAAVAAPVAWRMLRRYEEPLQRKPIDRVGLALLVVFVSALQLMLDLGKEKDWFASNEIVALAVVAAIGFVAFLIWELTEPDPIVDLRVFRHRGFTVGVLTIALGFGAMFGANVLTPLWLQSYMGYTSTWAGLATAWTGVLAIVAAPIAGKLTGHVDPRRLIFFGLAWLGLVMAARTVATTQMDYWQISVPLIAMGLGLPFFFVPVTALVLGSVEPHETASGAGLQNFLRTLAGAVSTSIVTTNWESRTSAIHADLVGSLDRSGDAAATFAAAGMTPDAGRSALDMLLQGQSVMLATNQVMAVVAVAFMLSAFAIWLAPRPAHAVDMTRAGH
jgi:DHA2 family multidrug resistance protein